MTVRHPTRQDLLPNGSRNTLLTLDTSIGHINPQTWTLLKITGMPCYMLLRRDLHHLALLWICGLPYSEFPPGYLPTPVESMPRRFASLLRARGGPTRY
ncbi:hypothetical protein AVEN_187706-1 [Araneus ventricosus]|uniref:Uncharacterized protein n=1 Tax=Araneus ventricosus TaxID=182803 RepID=A0A4Y2C1L5_ARAVE|nr:hypothetical protein AVEN_187706-1 [Araneus ventricosus]